jgi:hypothetical protein
MCEWLTLKIMEIKVMDSFLINQMSMNKQNVRYWSEKNPHFSESKEEGAARLMMLFGLRYRNVIGSFSLTVSWTVKVTCRYYGISHCRYLVNLEANLTCSCKAVSPPHYALPSSSLTRWGISRTVGLQRPPDLNSLSFSFWNYFKFHVWSKGKAVPVLT